MSAQLEKQAASQASLLSNVRRLFHTVPPITSSITLAGRTVLVTGSNVGLGLECARHFLSLRPKRLIMAVRSLKKGEAAAQAPRAEFPDTEIDVWELDLSSFNSVQAFAARCGKELDRLDVAVLNAGMGSARFVRADEGRKREITLQVNYLSTALLAVLLLPAMKPPTTSSSSRDPGHLTVVSSDAGLGVKLKIPKEGQGSILDSLDDPQTFSGFPQYAISKMLLTAFIARLAETVDPDEVVVNITNPSATKGTAFLTQVDSGLVKTLLGAWMSWFGRSSEEAARIYVHAALVLGRESHGSYTEWDIRAWPVMMYGENGRKFTERLWKETLEELSFAGVDKLPENSKQ
ncbi:hypothetical protein GE09DRAFT_988420 [Coniochaeta sp. 2T2.1]|nr:hypothetical protein GE09DRAFT_988420 [Coniochaeta sp. 2T2.1]